MLKVLIMKKGVSQNKIARSLGMSQTHVSNILTGKTKKFDLYIACEMLRAAGYSYEEINNITIGQLMEVQ